MCNFREKNICVELDDAEEIIQWKENCGKNDEKLKFQIFRAQFFIEQNRAKKLRGFTENIWGSKKENLLMM